MRQLARADRAARRCSHGKDVLVGAIDVATDAVETPERGRRDDRSGAALSSRPSGSFPAPIAAWRRSTARWRTGSSPRLPPAPRSCAAARLPHPGPAQSRRPPECEPPADLRRRRTLRQKPRHLSRPVGVAVTSIWMRFKRKKALPKAQLAAENIEKRGRSSIRVARLELARHGSGAGHAQELPASYAVVRNFEISARLGCVPRSVDAEIKRGPDCPTWCERDDDHQRESKHDQNSKSDRTSSALFMTSTPLLRVRSSPSEQQSQTPGDFAHCRLRFELRYYTGRVAFLEYSASPERI